jgi:hypothetical protein
MDPITLTIVGLVIAVVTFVPTTLAYIETRRQRMLAERTAVLPRSDTKPDELESSPAIWRCGIYDYPPLSSWPNNERPSVRKGRDTPTGPLVWLGQQVAEAIGKRVVFEYFNYDDFYQNADAIPDMIVGMFQTDRRSERVVFSRSVYEIGLQGLCRVNQKGDVLEGLRNGRLKAVVYSSEVGWEFVQDELTDAVKEHRVATLVGGQQMHTMALLREGVYDVVLMDQVSCVSFLADPGNRQRFKLAFREPPQKYRACIALRKEHRPLLTKINESLLRVRNTPEFLNLEQQALAGYERVIDRRGLRR